MGGRGLEREEVDGGVGWLFWGGCVGRMICRGGRGGMCGRGGVLERVCLGW